MIKIGSPFLRKVDDQVQLVSQITINDITQEMYYSVDKAYQDYLVTERVDAFVVALLPKALRENHDIEFEAPISEKLKFNLQNLLIPIMSKSIGYKSIQLIGSTSSDKLNYHHGVGTGFSAGVDSFHTLKTFTEVAEKGYELTHLTFLNVGSHGDYGGDKARELFHKRSKKPIEFAEEQHWNLVMIDSNISEILNLLFVESHTFRSLSAILAMQKLFRVYYYSSGYDFEEFKVVQQDTAYYDLLITQMISTEDLSFYSVDGHSSRLEKTADIATYVPSYNYLNVCQESEVNCGKCEKCRRTMLGLYATQNLDKYSSVFDVDYFNSNTNEYLGYLLFMRKNSSYAPILEKLRENNLAIPVGAYGQAVFFSFKNLFRNNDLVKDIYFKYIKNR